MNRVLALPAETQGRILNGVRRVELVMLLLTGTMFGLYYQPWGALLALPMLAAAVILVPRERTLATPTREQARVAFLNKADTQGRGLLEQYLEIRSRQISPARTHSQRLIRREIKLWIESCEARFEAYPEFAAIFASHDKQGGVLAELETCLTKLDELQRLCRISEKLRLPI
jgi:hypothetical protein